MLTTLKSYFSDLTHLVFPHHCEGCGTDVLQDEQLLCAACINHLPETNYITLTGNPVEKMFYGRLKLAYAGSGYYFTKESLIQHLIHQLKYKGNKDIGIYLGKLIGHQIKSSGRFEDVDALVPLPLNPKREFKRGYNQAAAICEGIAEIWKKPLLKDAVTRTIFTETQTQQDRVHRWENMDGVFQVNNEKAIKEKHVLLVDDIVTTGATLEACGAAILQVADTRLSLVTLACTL
jgi:ComF family protein